MKKLLFILLLSICAFSEVPQVTVPNTMSAGQPAKASEVQANWDTSYARINMLADTVNRMSTSISTDTAIVDSAKITKAEIDTLTGDTAFFSLFSSQKAKIDSIVNGSYIDTINSDTTYSKYIKTNRIRIDTAIIDSAAIVKADIDTILSCDTAFITSLKTNTFNPDTATIDTAYIGHLQVDSINVLDTGSFTLTLTGCTTSPTGTAYYTKIGDVVTLEIPQINGTSNSVAATLTGLPEKLRTTTGNKITAIYVRDNGSNIEGTIWIGSSGTIEIYPGYLGSFTASGSKGVNGCNPSYKTDRGSP